MNLDDFEQKLRDQPIRPVPAAWKAAILAAADPATLSPSRPEPQRRAWWRELFWPHPVAWAGLAAVWLLIGVAHRDASGNERAPELAASGGDSPELKLVLAEQRQLRRELLQSAMNPFSIPAEANTQPKAADRPRSSRRAEWGVG